MRLYHIGEKVIATHSDDQKIPASSYGDDVEITIVPDGTRLEPYVDEVSPDVSLSPFFKLPKIDEEDFVTQKRTLQVEELRSRIAENVGDTASVLGTVADASGVLVAVALSDIVALSTATDFAKYKKARLDALKALSGDTDIVAIAGEALGKIKSGEVILTASLKGLEETIAETLERSTGVVQVMVAATQGWE